MSKEERYRRCVSLDADTYTEMDDLLDVANVRNRNEFIEKAIRFYIGFLKTDRAESYLLTTYSAALQGTIGRTEDRLSRLMYKLAVEVAMQNRIAGYGNNLDENTIGIIRQNAEKEVKEIIGYWEKR